VVTRSAIIAFAIVTACISACSQQHAGQALAAQACSKTPIATESDATELAVRGLRQRYGAQQVDRQRPFHARRSNEFWAVVGTNPDQDQIAGNYSVVIDTQTGCVRGMQIDH
jgi:hypothetical protein